MLPASPAFEPALESAGAERDAPASVGPCMDPWVGACVEAGGGDALSLAVLPRIAPGKALGKPRNHHLTATGADSVTLVVPFPSSP